MGLPAYGPEPGLPKELIVYFGGRKASPHEAHVRNCDLVYECPELRSLLGLFHSVLSSNRQTASHHCAKRDPGKSFQNGSSYEFCCARTITLIALQLDGGPALFWKIKSVVGGSRQVPGHVSYSAQRSAWPQALGRISGTAQCPPPLARLGVLAVAGLRWVRCLTSCWARSMELLKLSKVVS